MTRFLCYPGVLGPQANAAVYRLALARRQDFERARIVGRGVDRRVRSSTVLHDDTLAGVAQPLRDAVSARTPEALCALGIAPFDPGDLEIQMTSHNDGEYFHRHTDAASPGTAGRMLTYVYYFHAEPKAYTGGELVFGDGDGGVEEIEPSNDMLVLFDPRTAHEVRPTRCPSGRFEDGRFTLNGWLHRRAGDRYFDRKIFTPVRRRPAGGRDVRSTAPAAARPRARSRREPPCTERMAGLLLLYGDLHRTGPAPGVVDAHPHLDADRFFAEYYSRNRPVLLPGVMAGAESVRTWSPARLAERFGDVELQITDGRNARPDYEQRYRETIRTATLAELVDRMGTGGESNDYYVVARNNALDNPRLRPLREALDPPAGIVDDADRRPGTAKLWIGPAGTLTPLHFDEHSILFAQIHGRKHVKLAPSFDYPRMYVRDEYYSEVDPERVDPGVHPLFAGVSLMDVTVGPGDCLFLPAGWWHWVRALSPSISATFSAFARPWSNTRLGRARTTR